MRIKSQIECKMCLLDVSDEVTGERLMGKRFNFPEKIAGLKQGTKTSEEFIEENKILMQELHDEIVLVGGIIIDTTNLNAGQTSEKLHTWVLENNTN